MITESESNIIKESLAGEKIFIAEDIIYPADENDIKLSVFIEPDNNPLMSTNSYDLVEYNINGKYSINLSAESNFKITAYKLNHLYLSLFNVKYYDIFPLFLLSMENSIVSHDKLPFIMDDIKLLFGINYLSNVEDQYQHELALIDARYQDYSISAIYRLMLNSMVITNYLNGSDVFLSEDNKTELLSYYNGDINIETIKANITAFIDFITDAVQSYEWIDTDLINRKYSYMIKTFGIEPAFNVDEVNAIPVPIDSSIDLIISEIDRNV